ncbi:phosphotransferase family protein [Pacificimonas sp. WHA3]|uniref:Phosphotransferase family protein n=1 Tax=Pacificimonas pallii TaxID=2827236 RepID=A0ABS6SDU2_9SPHN|nr:phosphotransferase family protein [Pacificimonas pallii]MBV7256549.1 phosphotransferase family protein [Pacificimonas pallii]
MSDMKSDKRNPRLSSVLSKAAAAEVTVTSMTALSGGAASMSYLVETERDGGPWPLVLQVSSGDETGDPSRTMSRAVQAALQQRAANAGMRVPAIVAVLEPEDGLGDGFVMEFVSGETLAPRYLRKPEFAAARERLTTDTAQALAQLHGIARLEFEGLGLPVLDGPAQLGHLRDVYDSLGGGVPVFEMAFARLKDRLPPCKAPVLVHGDFRSGNFIVGKDGLRSVLDWELAHIGDPLLDIGWLSTNTWRFGNWQKPVGGFGQREAFYTAYEAAGGRPVDLRTALAFEMLGSLRWGVMCMQMAAAHLNGTAQSVERAAIGRRVSETEADLIHIMKHGSV